MSALLVDYLVLFVLAFHRVFFIENLVDGFRRLSHAPQQPMLWAAVALPLMSDALCLATLFLVGEDGSSQRALGYGLCVALQAVAYLIEARLRMHARRGGTSVSVPRVTLNTYR